MEISGVFFGVENNQHLIITVLGSHLQSRGCAEATKGLMLTGLQEETVLDSAR